MMKTLSFLRSNIHCLYWSVAWLLFIGHILMFTVSPLNMEDITVAASDYFLGKNYDGLTVYFRYQANTLVFPWLGALTSRITHLDSLSSLRFLSLLGSLLLAKGQVRLMHNLGFSANNVRISVLLLLTNPIIFVFSSRAMNDALAFGISLYALSLMVAKKNDDQINWRSQLAQVICFSGAFCIKYHSLILYLLGVFMVGSKNKLISYKYLLSFLGIATNISIFLLAYENRYGITITPPRFQAVHSFDVGAVLPNFLGYLGYLVCAFLPLSICPSWQRGSLAKVVLIKKPKSLFLSIISVLIAFMLIRSILKLDGELNLGPIDLFIPIVFREVLCTFILSIFIYKAFLPFFKSTIESQSPTMSMQAYTMLLVSIATYLICLSPSRPANRYLIGIIPLYIMLLTTYIDYSKTILSTTICIALIGSGFTGLSAYANGRSYSNIIEYARTKDLLNNICSWDISPHVSATIDLENTADNKYCRRSFRIESGAIKGSIYTSTSGLMFPQKAYSIVKNN